MAKIHPFKGWRYDSEIIGDLTYVFVPPYDVITSEEQEQYYLNSPYSYIRINLNRNENEKRYSDAALKLQQWKNDSIINKEPDPALYILSQSFTHNGKVVDRVGCICELELSELGDTVLPHEQTIEKHLDDRYKLMESTQANTGQIFMCYQDANLVLEHMIENVSDAPVIDCELDEIRYRIWPITDGAMINSFQQCLNEKDVVIADGHHRYKTALKYFHNNPEVSGADRVMVTLVNSSNPGMNVLPTHRLLSGLQMETHDIIEKLNEHFEVNEFKGHAELVNNLEDRSAKKGQMEVYLRESDTGLLLNFRSWDKLEKMFTNQCKASRELDTNIMHSFVMKDIFNIDTSDQNDLKRVSYMRGNKPTLDLLNEEKDYDVACLINPPSLEEIFTIAGANETMPQKSTFFFPKVYSGLVTRCFNE
jgi:uncharacterized protein (DUF1015 family)